MSTELGQDFNNSQIRNDTDVMLLLNRLMSEEYFAMVWPHVLLLVVVMVLGIPGNALVIAVFFKIQRKKRYNSTQLLVIALAFADLVVCCLLIPFDIHRLRFYYSVKMEGPCDTFEYLRHTAMALSCFLLTSMAVERFRAICSLTTFVGENRRGTVVLLIVFTVVCSILSSPSVYFIGLEERIASPRLLQKFSSKVQQMYELVGRQVTIVSCEYLDKHDYTVGLRLFGSSSLFFFACLLATTVFCYGKIYHKIRLNHLSLNLVMRSNKIVPMSQATPSGSERSTAHNSRTRSVAEGIFTAASTITQPSPENAQATHNRKVPKSQTGQTPHASAKRLSTDIDATNSHDQNCDRNGSRFSPGAPVTTARRSTLHDEEHDSLDTDSVVFFVGKETSFEQSDKLGQDESNTQHEPSSRGSRINGINLSVPENTYNIFIVSNKRNPAGQQNGGHELFPVETRNKSGLFLKPPSEFQGSFPRVLSRRGSSGNRNRQSDTYPEPFTERSRDSETPKPILPPVASEIWPQGQPSTNSNNRAKPTRSPTIKINGRNFNSMPETHTLRFTKQIRVAKLLLMVTGVFLLSYLPFWVVTFLFMVWPHLDWDQGPVGTVFLSMMYQSYFINNAANPILYAIYSPEFRKESAHLLRLVKQKLCGRQVGVA